MLSGSPGTHLTNRHQTKFARMPMDKVFVNINRYGNTSAASVPIALHEALIEGRIKPGDKVVLISFGAGATLGATLLEW